jgi:hypothetical protein
VEAARAGSDYLARETLALELSLGDAAAANGMSYSETATIDGLGLTISLSPASAGP